jgi:hypothetical protein
MLSGTKMEETHITYQAALYSPALQGMGLVTNE